MSPERNVPTFGNLVVFDATAGNPRRVEALLQLATPTRRTPCPSPGRRGALLSCSPTRLCTRTYTTYVTPHPRASGSVGRDFNATHGVLFRLRAHLLLSGQAFGALSHLPACAFPRQDFGFRVLFTQGKVGNSSSQWLDFTVQSHSVQKLRDIERQYEYQL